MSSVECRLPKNIVVGNLPIKAWGMCFQHRRIGKRFMTMETFPSRSHLWLSSMISPRVVVKCRVLQVTNKTFSLESRGAERALCVAKERRRRRWWENIIEINSHWSWNWIQFSAEIGEFHASLQLKNSMFPVYFGCYSSATCGGRKNKSCADSKK